MESEDKEIAILIRIDLLLENSDHKKKKNLCSRHLEAIVHLHVTSYTFEP